MRVSSLEAWILGKIGSAAPRLDIGELRAYQLRKVRETMSLARERSPFYRRLLAGSGEVAALEDLADVPFTTAADISERAAQFLCVSQSEISRVVTLPTSGTSGPPKRLFFTAADQELTVDFFHHGMAGVTKPGERVLILFPGERPGGIGELLLRGLERLGATGVPHGFVTDVSATLAVMAREGTGCVAGLPSQVLALARWAEAVGVRGPGVRSALLSADYVPGAVVAELERIWGCKVFNHYGMTEMGLGGGVECDALAGYHLREADLYFEVVDPATGRPVPDGTAGEVVFTTLTRWGMPLIRYRTGDVSAFLTGPCPCGSGLRRLARVRERVAGAAWLAGGRLTAAELSEALFAVPGLVDFDAGVSTVAGEEVLRVRVKLVPGRSADLPAVRAALAAVPALAGTRITLEAADAAEPMLSAKKRIADFRK